MPVPTSISDLSTTPAANSPAGSESVSSVDDYLRTHGAFIKQINDATVNLTGTQTITGAKTFQDAVTFQTPVAVSSGGTGATTASAARTSLGAGATGDTLFTSTTAAGARSTLGLATIASSGSASDLTTGTVPTARLGSGTANSSTYLRGDQTWATVSGGVTSLTAGNGITVSASTGAVTVSQDFYAGTSDTNLSFPIGSYVLALIQGDVRLAGTATLRIQASTELPRYYLFKNFGGGSVLSGTWRIRGGTDVATDTTTVLSGTFLFQRVA